MRFQKRFFIIIGIIIIILAVFILCYKKGSVELLINYHYESELDYQDIKIKNSTLIYTYFEDNGACSEWLYQSPCWQENDFKTKQKVLQEKEINELIDLAKDFMKLQEVYGAEEGDRYYPIKIKIRLGEEEKEVVYRSSLGVEPAPKAFQEIEDKLFELID